MLDRYAIKIIKWPLKTLAALPDKLGISANQVTITGF
ncbi:CDP-alcohol phosphatidyltransferase family protein, partial [Photobacterium damselae]